MKCNVFQIPVTREMVDYINLAGREAGMTKYPSYAAQFEVSFIGSKAFETEMFNNFYVKTAEVFCDKLEDAFRICNLWDEPWLVNVLTKLDGTKMRSLSVGDIVELNGTFFMCDPCGWKEVGVNV